MRADALLYRSSTLRQLSVFEFGQVYGDTLASKRALRLYAERYLNMKPDTNDAPVLVRSAFYVGYLINTLRAKYRYLQLTGATVPEDFYDYIKSSEYTGILKDKLVTDYLVGRSHNITSKMINEALEIVKEPRYRQYLNKMKETFSEGILVDSSYSFVAKNGDRVSIGQLRGKVVFIDMWFTGCAGCIQLAQALPAVEQEFEGDSRVVFVSLSVDRKKETWLKSIADRSSNGPGKYFITDHTLYLNTGPIGSYHPFLTKYNPKMAYPHLLLIGKDGRIFSANVTAPNQLNGKEKLIQEIREAINAKGDE